MKLKKRVKLECIPLYKPKYTKKKMLEDEKKVNFIICVSEMSKNYTTKKDKYYKRNIYRNLNFILFIKYCVEKGFLFLI